MARNDPLSRVVVVGASLAGLRAAERLRNEGYGGALTIVGDEPHAPYDRPPLSKELLAGTRRAEEIALHGGDALNAEWLLGDGAAALDLDRRVVRTALGRELVFDGLVIATGSVPRRLLGIDPHAGNVYELRTLDDALALRAALTAGAHLLIVGSGFIGVEVAATARARGAEVTMVGLDPPLHVAGAHVSSVARRMLADAGVTVHTGRRVSATRGGGRVRAVVLDDGTRIEPDAVLVAVGARPAIDWLEGSGLPIADGVVCDASCAVVGTERVVAAGDVARWPNPLFGGATMRVEHWTNAVEQGGAAARTLLHGSGSHTEHASVPSFWSHHFGRRLQSVGLPTAADRLEVVAGSLDDERFAIAGYRRGRLVGAVAYGMPQALAPLRAQLARRAESDVPGQLAELAGAAR